MHPRGDPNKHKPAGLENISTRDMSRDHKIEYSPNLKAANLADPTPFEALRAVTGET